MNKTKIQIGILMGIIVVAGVMFGFNNRVLGNKSSFVPTVQTSSATTSPDYMLASNSTLTLDAYTYQPNALNGATLFIQSTASSSASVQTLTIQYSQDGIDWFQDNLATTTSASVVALSNTQRTYTITGNTTASTTRMAIDVATPTRFVRATVATSTNFSSVWMQWIPIRENN